MDGLGVLDNPRLESRTFADSLSRLLYANKQVEPSSAYKVSDEFVRFVKVTATPQAIRQHVKSKKPHQKTGNWLNCVTA